MKSSAIILLEIQAMMPDIEHYCSHRMRGRAVANQLHHLLKDLRASIVGHDEYTPPEKRRIIQIIGTRHYLFALCNDGTIWQRFENLNSLSPDKWILISNDLAS